MRYLDSIWSQLPSGVKAFIREEWFYDGSDHRCRHDAWLEEFTIQEVGLGERFQYRNLDIRTTLLGAFHDKRLQFAYSNVTSYLVKCSISAGAQTRRVISFGMKCDTKRERLYMRQFSPKVRSG